MSKLNFLFNLCVCVQTLVLAFPPSHKVFLFSFTICPVIIVSPLNLFTCLEGEICAELASVALHYTQRPIFAIFYNGLFPGPILYDVLSPSYLKIEMEIFSYLTSFCLRKDDHVDI